MSTNRRFGVEIEFLIDAEDEEEAPCTCYECRRVRIDRGEEEYPEVEESEEESGPVRIAQRLTEAGVPCYYAGYTHEVREAWKIVSDGSVSGGWELVSPPLTWARRGEVETACRVLEGLGASVDRSCGLHVHHEVSDLDLGSFKRLYVQWWAWQDQTAFLVAPERRDCQWAGRLTESDVARVQEAESVGELQSLCSHAPRYKALNVCSFPLYGTVEVRQHQGTLDATAILSWVAYGQAIVESAIRPWAVDTRAMRAAKFASYIEGLPFLRPEARERLKGLVVA